jgi:hypothetical protein
LNNFFWDQWNWRKAISNTCKDKDGKAAMVHFKVLRAEDRCKAYTTHITCILGTDIDEEKITE